MGKIIIMSLKSNEKLKSRSKVGTTWKEATAPKQQTPHHHCMHCILQLCIFTCPLCLQYNKSFKDSGFLYLTLVKDDHRKKLQLF